MSATSELIKLLIADADDPSKWACTIGGSKVYEMTHIPTEAVVWVANGSYGVEIKLDGTKHSADSATVFSTCLGWATWSGRLVRKLLKTAKKNNSWKAFDDAASNALLGLGESA